MEEAIEKFLKFVVYGVYFLLLGGAAVYFLMFCFMLLRELSGSGFLVAVFTMIVLGAAYLNVLIKMFKD